MMFIIDFYTSTYYNIRLYYASQHHPVPCTHKRYGIYFFFFTFMPVRDFDLLADDS